MIRHSPHLSARDLDRIPHSELPTAARWWARNGVMMSAADPARPHLPMIAHAALLAPSARLLGTWLSHAHDALRGARAITTIYEQAYLELVSEHPPWLVSSRLGLGHDLYDQHEMGWAKDICTAELAIMLDELRQQSGGHNG